LCRVSPRSATEPDTATTAAWTAAVAASTASETHSARSPSPLVSIAASTCPAASCECGRSTCRSLCIMRADLLVSRESLLKVNDEASHRLAGSCPETGDVDAAQAQCSARCREPRRSLAQYQPAEQDGHHRNEVHERARASGTRSPQRQCPGCETERSGTRAE